MNVGRAVVGGVVGALFMGHGAQKLFGAFGGHGLEGTGQFFESGIGLRPGKLHAAAAGSAELLGGASMATGVATPAGAAALHGTMATAIWTVHKDKGVWNTEGGFEYNAVLMAVVFGLTANRVSVPAAIASLAAGVGGAAALLATARQEPEQPGDEPAEPQPASGGERAAPVPGGGAQRDEAPDASA